MNKIKLLLIALFTTLLLSGCDSGKVELMDFVEIKSTDEIKENKLYLVLYEANGCYYCKLQKKVFNDNLYTRDEKLKDYNFIVMNKNDLIYDEMTKIKDMENKRMLFPMMYTITRKNGKIIVLEEFTGYTKDEVLDYILIHNLNEFKELQLKK